MSTYARLVDGFALDCQVASTAAELAARYNPEWLARNPFVVVPDGTLHGATDNGNGTFTNPVIAAPTPVAQTLSATGFQDVCEAGLGSNARFGEIIRGMADSADNAVFSAYQRFMKSVTFDKNKAAPLFSLLVSKGLMTGPERTAILNAWPNV